MIPRHEERILIERTANTLKETSSSTSKVVGVFAAFSDLVASLTISSTSTAFAESL